MILNNNSIDGIESNILFILSEKLNFSFNIIDCKMDWHGINGLFTRLKNKVRNK